MFEGKLYTIKHITCKENKVLATIMLNRGHEVFKGHFPDMPVLPGACTLQIIKEVLSKEINKSLTLIQGDNIKFISIVNPDKTTDLDIDITILSNTSDLVQANFMVADHGMVVFKMKGVYKCVSTAQ